MTVTIVGVGNIGSRLARDVVKGGQQVVIANRTLDKAQALADELGPLATAASIEDGIQQSDVVVLAVMLPALQDLVKEYSAQLDGKVVVDPSNPLRPDGKGGMEKSLAPGESSGELIRGLLPAGARFVKAFGTLSAPSLESAAHQDPAQVLFYATDDEAAGQTVSDLIRAAGFAPVNAGGVDQSNRIEFFGELHEAQMGRTLTEDEAKKLV